MSKIETGRFSELLRRALGMKGVSDVATELSPEVSPTWELESPTAEWDFLKGKKLCIATATVAAAVGFQAAIRLRNPATSGVLAVLEAVVWVTNPADNTSVRYGIANVDLSTAGGTLVRDHRWLSSSATVRAALLFSADNTGDTVAGQVVHRTSRAADVEAQLPGGFVLTPGDSIDLQTGSVNIGLRATYIWSERQLPELER